MRISLISMVTVILCSFCYAETTNNVTVKLTYHQTIEGFGQGNMEQFTPVWYKKYNKEKIEEILDVLYTLKNDGLGLSICRYPMPAADDPSHTHMSRLPQNANKPFEYENGKWNWQGHEDVLWLGKGAADRGVKMWASWYGFPWWLSTSGCSAGSSDGISNNLKAGQEARFIKHVIDVMKYFQKEWKISFDYVCPINEPEADWWKAGGGQPGSHVSAEQAIILYNILSDKLSSEGFNKCQIIAYDAAYTNSTEYLKELLKGGLSTKIDVFACHQYVTSESALKEWAQIGNKLNKSIWMSEWADWENSHNKPGMEVKQMMNYAQKLHEAFYTLNANAWVMWEAGFIFNTTDNGLEKRKSYWATAQYSRHIRPGTRRIESSDSSSDCHTTAWIDKSKKQVIFITVNTNSQPVRVCYNLDLFNNIQVKEIRTTDPSDSYRTVTDFRINKKELILENAGQSIVTVVVEFTPD